MTDKIPQDMKDSVNKVWLAGLGAMAVAEEEGSKLFKNLVERGETYETKGRERWDGMKSKVEETSEKAKGNVESKFDVVGDKLDDAVANTLRRLGVPSRDEIATLTKRVEELTAVVEQLSPERRPAAKTAAAKTAPAKKAAAKKTDDDTPAN